MPTLPRLSKSTERITFGDIAGSVARLKIARNLSFEWQINPSVGLVAKDLDRLGLDIRSFKEPLSRAIKKVMIPSFKKNFEEEGRPAWLALAPDTVKLRGNDSPILKRTGALAKGATQFNIWDIGQTSAAIRQLPDRVSYGAVHQSGYGSFASYQAKAKADVGPRAGGRKTTKRAFEILDASGSADDAAKVAIPQRQFIMIQDEDVPAIEQVFFNWFMERALRSGRFK